MDMDMGRGMVMGMEMGKGRRSCLYIVWDWLKLDIILAGMMYLNISHITYKINSMNKNKGK